MAEAISKACSCVAEGVRLSLRLTPGAAKNDFGPLAEDAAGVIFLKARVTSVPEKGKANKSLLKMLAKALKIPVGSISVASGLTNRNKQILIKGDSAELSIKLDHWFKEFKT